MPRAAEGADPRRARVLPALVLVVAAVHLVLAERYRPATLAGPGAMPARIEVAFVRELAPAPPAAPPPVPRPAPRLARLVAPPPAASAPAQDTTAALWAEPLQPLAAEPSPALEAAPAWPELAHVAPVPASLAASASADTAFDWPPSTRLSYHVTGNFRGPVEGQAQVEWLRQGRRYQVHMDVSVGPPFAPLFARRVSSEGLITPEGLQPRRYDEETRALLRETRRLTVWLDEDRVRLPEGSPVPRPPGVQDSASQFVQMTWLFITGPERLTPGSSLELPLALPRRVEPWVYEVVGSERVATSVGEVEAVHVRPRRTARPGGELTPELWVAPSLQYLPVRMLITRDAQTWIDLTIERLPQQAAPGR